MRRYLLLLLTTLVLTACGGDPIAAGGEASAAGGTDGTAVADTPPARSSQAKDLAISCHFAARQLRVTCTATGYTEGARLFWWTNSEPAEAEGAKFEFAVTHPVPNLTVSFEECNSGKCQTVTTTLDTTKAAATVVIKPGQVVQIPMAPAINPDGSPKRPSPSKQGTAAATGPQQQQSKPQAAPPGVPPAPQPGAPNPQMEACFKELLSQEAFQAIYTSKTRPPTEAEKTLLERCYQPSDTSGPSSESVFGTDLTGCSNKVTKFDAPPVALAQIVHIEPMGKMAGISGHITPTDHLYIRATSTGPKSIPVQAIADGFLVKITQMPDREGLPDWRAIIEHSCSVFSWYIHLDVFSETILQQITIPSDRPWHGRIPLKSGEPVGYVGEMLSYQRGFDVDTDDFDWAVTDTSTVLPGFIIPDHYRGEAWKIHSVDPFDYYDDPLKNALRKKSLRTAAPVGGKIDFDIDGRLVGNWFLDGTRDYFASGLAEAGESAWPKILGMDPGNCKIPLWDNDLGRDIGYTPCAYWLGQAVFAYEYRDHDIVLVSLGLHYDGYGGVQAPWMVVNNGPDPAQVSIDTGQVKYELVESNASTGDLARQEPPSSNEASIGTLLVEMLDARSIKVELFIGMRADNVNGFTELARIYRR